MSSIQKPRLRYKDGRWLCGRVYWYNGEYFHVISTTGIGNSALAAWEDFWRLEAEYKESDKAFLVLRTYVEAPETTITLSEVWDRLKRLFVRSEERNAN